MRFYTGVRGDIPTDIFKRRATRAAHVVAAAAAADMQQFVPFSSGALQRSLTVDGRKASWTMPYAGILLYGKLMVDPKFMKGGFPMPNYGPNVFRSRRDVKKVNSGRPLIYHIGTRNWIREAQSAYGDRWLKMARKELSHD